MQRSCDLEPREFLEFLHVSHRRQCRNRLRPRRVASRPGSVRRPGAGRYVAGLRRAGIGGGEVRVIQTLLRLPGRSRLTAGRATQPMTGRDPTGGPGAGRATVSAARAHDTPLLHREDV
jgi:hypothetical protein